MLSVLNPWKLSSLVLNATMCTWVRSRSPRFGLTRLFIRLTVVLEVSGSGIRRRLSGQQKAVSYLSCSSSSSFCTLPRCLPTSFVYLMPLRGIRSVWESDNKQPWNVV